MRTRSIGSSTRSLPVPNLHEVFDRLKATRREYYVVADAVRRLRDAVKANQVPVPPNTSLRDYDAALLQLEPTYLVRLWAEFETALRSYRRHFVGNPEDNIRAFDHEVREYRNSLVHERDVMAPAVGIDEARRRLSTYLSKLPDQW
jgi:hypothetical protein